MPQHHPTERNPRKNGRKFGKPKTEERARTVLREMRGKTHSVVTGYTVIDTKTGKEISRIVKTKVHFRNLTGEAISDYVATGEPLEKAGAYAIQGKGAALVEKIEGNYDNVVGLPLEETLRTLEDFDVTYSG